MGGAIGAPPMSRNYWGFYPQINNRSLRKGTDVNNIIKVSIRNSYGEDRVYPLNSQATRLAMLAGTKTLTRGTLDIAKAMGFEIQIESATTLDDIFA